jgi:hypothetical protein
MNGTRVQAAELEGLASTPGEVARFVVETAVQAPSVHNTQPWWFSLARAGEPSGGELSVHADPDRRLHIADPDGREMLISCGAALFTARVAMRRMGLVPKVTLLPDPDLPNLVARIAWLDHVPTAEYERQLFDEVSRRRTHRGGFDDEPLPAGLISALRAEASTEKATMRIMGDEGERGALAAAVEAADFALRLDSARAKEESKWASAPGSRRRDGVPVTAYQARPDRIDPAFPSRDFAHGHGWGLPGQAGRAPLPRAAGLVVVLTTATDEPLDWIRAGQALQRVLLLASSNGVRAALHSQPLEFAELRSFIRTRICGGAHPQMVLRLGSTPLTAVSVRRPVDQVLL